MRIYWNIEDKIVQKKFGGKSTDNFHHPTKPELTSVSTRQRPQSPVDQIKSQLCARLSFSPQRANQGYHCHGLKDTMILKG